MNLNPYNLERTAAPKRRVPWWVYAGAVLLVILIVFALLRALPGRKNPDAAEAEPVAEAEAEETAGPAAPVSGNEPGPVPQPTPPAAGPQPAAPAAASAAPPAAPIAAQPQLELARKARTDGDYAAARARALEVWNSTQDPAIKSDAESILNEVGIALVFSPRAMPEKVEYVVASGDSLEKIAKKFNTTVELVRAGNNIKGHLIKVGDRLRVLQGTFSVKVSKSRNDLELYLNDQFFKRYRVGTGEFNKTPVGDFVTNDRIPQPTWWRPDGKAVPYGDPENLLGTHWISINVKGYGLHGTWEPDTIGKQLSAGCVRMLNEDIEQLFTLLPLGTPVSIRD